MIAFDSIIHKSEYVILTLFIFTYWYYWARAEMNENIFLSEHSIRPLISVYIGPNKRVFIYVAKKNGKWDIFFVNCVYFLEVVKKFSKIIRNVARLLLTS